jgi:hypothetical protein
VRARVKSNSNSKSSIPPSFNQISRAHVCLKTSCLLLFQCVRQQHLLRVRSFLLFFSISVPRTPEERTFHFFKGLYTCMRPACMLCACVRGSKSHSWLETRHHQRGTPSALNRKSFNTLSPRLRDAFVSSYGFSALCARGNLFWIDEKIRHTWYLPEFSSKATCDASIWISR